MTDHVQEQEMEIEALKAILMDEFEEIHPSESGLNTSNRCYLIKLSLQDDETDESSTSPGLTLDIFFQVYYSKTLTFIKYNLVNFGCSSIGVNFLTHREISR